VNRGEAPTEAMVSSVSVSVRGTDIGLRHAINRWSEWSGAQAPVRWLGSPAARIERTHAQFALQICIMSAHPAHENARVHSISF
jgi:hypothetical protein